MSADSMVIGGVIKYRRFAYLHKRDRDRFGLLEAVDRRDARDHLGSAFHLRQTWLTYEQFDSQRFDRDRRWEIVSSVFFPPPAV